MCNPMVKGLRKSFVSLERIFYMSPSQLCKKFYHVWPRFKVHLHSFHVFTQTYLSELSSWFISKGWDLSWHNCCLWHCLWQHCSARGVWGHCSPRIFWKMEVARMCFPPFWAEMWCDSELESAITCMCGESMFPVCSQHKIMWTCAIVITHWLCTSKKCSNRGQTKQGLNYVIKDSLLWRIFTKEQGILTAWEIILSAWEPKIEFVWVSESHA